MGRFNAFLASINALATTSRRPTLTPLLALTPNVTEDFCMFLSAPRLAAHLERRDDTTPKLRRPTTSLSHSPRRVANSPVSGRSRCCYRPVNYSDMIALSSILNEYEVNKRRRRDDSRVDNIGTGRDADGDVSSKTKKNARN